MISQKQKAIFLDRDGTINKYVGKAFVLPRRIIGDYADALMKADSEMGEAKYNTVTLSAFSSDSLQNSEPLSAVMV